MLFIGLVALAATQTPAVTSISLARGDHYWDVQDTVLDSAQPDLNFGGLATLTGGPGKTVLIRYGSLERIVGRGQKIDAASIELTVSGGDAASLKSVSAVPFEWSEGPRLTFAALTAKADTPPAPFGAANWKFGQAGNQNSAWQGAVGGTAVSFQTRVDTKLTIMGLAEAFNRFAKRPWQNFGLALRFSSKSKLGRPILHLTTSAETQITKSDLACATVRRLKSGALEAVVSNVGSEASAATTGHWTIKGKSGEPITIPPVAPGSTVSFALPNPPRPDSADHRYATVDFTIDPIDDADASNNSARYYVGGIDLEVDGINRTLRSATDGLNQVALKSSQYSFAPEGCLERINISGPVANWNSVDSTILAEQRRLLGRLGFPIATNADPYAGISCFGDTRDETFLNQKLALIPIPHLPDEESTGLLSMSEVAELNARVTKQPIPTPKVVLVRVLNRCNSELARVTLDFFKPGELKTPTYTMKIGNASSAILPNVLKTGDWRIRATFADQVCWTTLSNWELIAESARGNAALALIELRLNLSTDPIANENVAKDRVAKASDGSDITAVTSETNPTPIRLPEKPGDWIELDLKRDRTIAEVILDTQGRSFWRQFKVMVYGTAETPGEAFEWMTEGNSDWSRANLTDDAKQIPYRGSVVRARYIRIINVSGGSGELATIKVNAVKGGVGG